MRINLHMADSPDTCDNLFENAAVLESTIIYRLSGIQGDF